MAENAKHLLLVDDEAALREAIAERLADHGFIVEQAANGEDALARLSEFAFDIIVTDLRLPGVDGRAVLEASLERYPEIIAIIITGFGTVKDAVNAIKQGAADFLTKPFQFDSLLHVLNSALEQRRLRSENAYLRSQLEDRYRIDGLIGRSRVMRDLSQLLETVAATASTVLITGETGTGKELAARAIHHGSPRRANRFVAINCRRFRKRSSRPSSSATSAARSPARSERGRAVSNRRTRTFFLDEVGTMSPALQAKLLRVLQEREFERVGDAHTIKIDVRVIAATHSDLARMVAEGTFREDLFYRLNVIPVQLPALRERRDDIPLLVQHFLEKLGGEQVPPRHVTMSQDALRRLMAYAWPGNVRQLENVVERALAFSHGRSQIDVPDLGPDIQNLPATPEEGSTWFPDEGMDLERYIEGVELTLIKRSLERTQGNKVQAARLLNLKRTTLIEKLKRLERGQPGVA